MALTIPELKLPLGGISACSSAISLEEYPELSDVIPTRLQAQSASLHSFPLNSS
jgi:hypothetical protein